MTRLVQTLFAGCFVLAISIPGATAVRAQDSATLKKLFADPPRQYSSAPLWVWNDMLTEDQVRGTLRDLAGQKVKQAFVHPRPGLMTPYLSADWFRLWRAALDEAEKLDMNIWIYDENSYPSGFAGGWVPEMMPEARGRGLVFKEGTRPGRSGPDVLGIYRIGPDRFENVTEQARRGPALPEGKYLTARVIRAANSPWHGDRCYVDLMYPGVTEKFLEVTHEAYRQHVGDQFGKRVLGSFTDEPNIRPAGGLPWTDHLPAAFQKRWGYNLLDHLPSLQQPIGDWKRVRHNYFQVLSEQFIEHWSKPYSQWCEKHGISWTGHYWDHDWPHCTGVPDNMAMYAWHQIPAIDCLMNQYREDTHAQFGNARMVKELASVANQLGRDRRLCEVYGAGGWDLRFEDMKRIGDWLEVLGVNFLDEHLSYVTIRGARKADHPQSFSYHEPWWDSYHEMAGYFSRLTAAISHGEQRNEILVIEPTTTAWMYQADATQVTKLDDLGKSFFDLVMSLESAQVEYDLGCEDVIARHGKAVVEGRSGTPPWFRVGRAQYHTVVLPPGTETLNAPTIQALKSFLKAGGTVVSCDPAPSMVDGRASGDGEKLAKSRGWRQVKAEQLAETLTPPGRDSTRIRRTPGDKGILFHQRRRLADGDLLLLVNTSIEAPSSGLVESGCRDIESWDCHTGKTARYPFKAKSDAVEFSFQLPPCGSLLLFLSRKPRELQARHEDVNQGRLIKFEVGIGVSEPKGKVVPPAGPIQVRRLGPNVLTLDYLDVTVGGESLKNAYFYRANQFAFQQNGMPANPWDSAVQFKDELISKKFPPGSGLKATYRFNLEGAVPEPLWIVLERPDLYTVTCNGVPVSAKPGAWWLDRAFGKIDITAAVQTGENAVTIEASPMTIYHELEPAYLLGDFSLKPVEHGFAIVPPSALEVKRTAAEGLGWNRQGCPFYAEGVAYSQAFEVSQPAGRYVVSVPDWYGSVGKVLVNGNLAGYLAAQPWKVDVTGEIQAGTNTVEVIVIGTLKNTLGPHHIGKLRGSAWPASFHQGPANQPPGAAYDTIGYGLFGPFTLNRHP
jgi:hypothetical protein